MGAAELVFRHTHCMCHMRVWVQLIEQWHSFQPKTWLLLCVLKELYVLKEILF